MRMVPPTVSRETRSGAEKRVFKLLSEAEWPHATALHSLTLSEHEYKRWGELDFVIVAPEALIVLEVKGGGVANFGGIWEFTDRFGEPHRSSEGPFKQAQSGLMGLRDQLSREIRESDLRELAFGYGVVLPDTIFGASSVEWSPWQIADRRRTKTGAFDKWLYRLVREWRTKLGVDGTASGSVVKAVTDMLRPSFERVPSIAAAADEAVAVMERLTSDQYQLLDAIEDNHRILCEGGAGTGKTFLALEVARRAVRREEKVLFTTSGAHMREFVRKRIPSSVEVVTYEQAAALPTIEPASFLIADETQDVLDADGLSLLDGLVEGGLARGRWAIFLDRNAQAGIAGRFDPTALELLSSTGAVTVHLRHNCRNTRPIVLQTRLLTGADLGTAEAGAGPEVAYDYAESASIQAANLENHIADLLAQGVAPSEIVVLSPVELAASSASQMSTKMRVRLTDDRSDRRIAFSTVSDFKGLESKYVAVVDLDWVQLGSREVATLYVAMSRAQASLWVGLLESARPALTAAASANAELVAGTLQQVSR